MQISHEPPAMLLRFVAFSVMWAGEVSPCLLILMFKTLIKHRKKQRILHWDIGVTFWCLISVPGVFLFYLWRQTYEHYQYKDKSPKDCYICFVEKSIILSQHLCKINCIWCSTVYFSFSGGLKVQFHVILSFCVSTMRIIGTLQAQ